MSNQFLKLRRSAVPGRVPSTSSIDFGEIALNTFDGLAFIKKSGSLGEEVVTLGSREGAFTGSFSGSFFGNGGGLFNIPASGIVGLNLSQIATGSVTASVSTGAGSFSLVSGSSTFLYVSSSGNVGIGTSTPNAALQIVGGFNASLSSNITATTNSILSFNIVNSATVTAGSELQVGNTSRTTLFGRNAGSSFSGRGVTNVGSTDAYLMALFGGNLVIVNQGGNINFAANGSTTHATLFSTGNFSIGSTSDTGDRLYISGSSRFTGNMVVTGSATITNGDLSVFKSSQPTINFQDQTGFNNGYQNASFGIWSSSSKNFLINVWGKTGISVSSHNFNNTGLSTVTLNSTGLNGFIDTNGGHSLVIPFSSTTQRALTIVRTENTTNTSGYDAIRLSSATYGTYTFFRVDDIGNIYSRGSGIFGSETSFGSERLQVSGSARITDGLSVTGSITANNITVTGTLTAQTIVAQTITSSTDYVSGSTIFGNSLSNTHQFTGSVSITGSLSLPYLTTGSVLFVGTNGAVSQDNSNLFWDNTNGRLGIGTNAPICGIDARNRLRVTGTSGIVGAIGSNTYGLSVQNNASATWIEILNNGGANKGVFFGITSDRTPDTFELWNYQGGAIDFYNAATATSGTRKLRIWNNGNVTIQDAGSYTDTGERLQVSGSSRFAGNMVISGSGNTSATNALAVLNSSNLNTFRVRNDGNILFGNSGTPILAFTYSSVYDTTDINGTNLSIYPLAGSISLGGGTQAQTSGNQNNVITKGRFQPTSGTATFTEIRSEPLINQTGGANGITRGLYVNPTLTAAADFRAIEWSNNAATAPSASWGLYGAGTAPNYLSGSLGIGIVPFSGSAAINSSVEIGSGNLVVASFTSIGRINIGGYGAIGSNYYLDSSPGNLRRKNGDFVSVMDMPTGGFRWHTSAVGAANSVISLTQLMVLNNDGNLGLGVTSPTAKLDVRGNTFVSGTLDILDAKINYQRNNNVTTGSARLIASIPTASLNAAFFDYVIVSGSNARAGTVTSVWVSSSVEWNETYTNDIGSTSDVTLYSAITGSSIGLFATSSINNVWTIKSLIRTI